MNSLWERYQKHLVRSGALPELAIDLVPMRFDDTFSGRVHLTLQSGPAEDTFKA